MGLSEDRIKLSWKFGSTASARIDGEYVLLGDFSQSDANRLTRDLEKFGAIEAVDDGQSVALSLRSDGRMGLDALLEKSWRLGATDAFVVRGE